MSSAILFVDDDLSRHQLFDRYIAKKYAQETVFFHSLGNDLDHLWPGSPRTVGDLKLFDVRSICEDPDLSFSLVVVDLVLMEFGDGFEVIRQIQREYSQRDLPLPSLIAISSFTGRRDITSIDDPHVDASQLGNFPQLWHGPLVYLEFLRNNEDESNWLSLDRRMQSLLESVELTAEASVVLSYLGEPNPLEGYNQDILQVDILPHSGLKSTFSLMTRHSAEKSGDRASYPSLVLQFFAQNERKFYTISHIAQSLKVEKKFVRSGINALKTKGLPIKHGARGQWALACSYNAEQLPI